MNVKKTTLFNLHKKHGAKFVNFAGYDMPIQYKDGIIQEHRFTRSNSGIFDVSHMGQLFINEIPPFVVLAGGCIIIFSILFQSFLGNKKN